MQTHRLVLPLGNSQPIRGDARGKTTHLAAAASSISFPSRNLAVLDQTPSTSMAVVKHDEEIAKVTNHAYIELARLQQVAATAAAASSPLSPRNSRSSTVRASSSSMFIKTKPKKQSSKRSDLEAMLDRYRNALKSREVCRLLSASQLDKLKSDTIELERMLQAKSREGAQGRELEDVMMSLKVEDGESKAATDRHESEPSRYATRGKVMMLSVQENEKLQRDYFEAEQEMNRSREYESMGKQMGKMNLLSSARFRYDSKWPGRNASYERDEDDDEDQDVDNDVLGIGSRSESESQRRPDMEEADMEIQDNDEW